MEIDLKRIKKESFDDIRNKVIDDFKETGTITIDTKFVEENSEQIFVDGQSVKICLDLGAYDFIVNMNCMGYTKLAKVGMQLHKDFHGCKGIQIPRNIFYEKEVWAYLSLVYFSNIVKQLRLDDDDKITEDKIKRFYFNSGGISRTGLLFLWVMIDKLESEDNYSRSLTAFEFIDPVKAILERTISKNPIILRAFVDAIIKNDKDPRIKSAKNKLRTRIPNSISCYAAVSLLDAFEYDDLVNAIAEEQLAVLNLDALNSKES